MNKQDWTGNTKAVFSILGSSNHVLEDREANDYYATDPIATKMLLQLESFENVLEPSCGEGHISKVLENAGIKTTSSDLIDRGFGTQKDFFSYDKWDGDIVTNPPYTKGKDYVSHALRIVPVGRKVAIFWKIQFLEGQSRYKTLFQKHPFKTLYVSTKRIVCAKNGEFIVNGKKISSGAVGYGWYVWERGFKGDPIIKWFN
jgi:hypothetical protein